MKSKIIAAMDAAGYFFDELESTDDNLCFLGEGGTRRKPKSGSGPEKIRLRKKQKMCRIYKNSS